MALVAGATGTGKTVSLMVLAEGFSRLGVERYPRRIASLVAGHGPHCTSGAGRFQPWPCRTRTSSGVVWK